MRVLLVLAVLALTGALVGVAFAAGSPKAGKKVYNANGCGSCHVFKPAGSTGKVGPPLSKARLAADAKKAKQKLEPFVRTSIVKPDAFVPKGYRKGVMPATYGKSLTKKQLNDLVAFILKG